jgi:hypothetical protein
MFHYIQIESLVLTSVLFGNGPSKSSWLLDI